MRKASCLRTAGPERASTGSQDEVEAVFREAWPRERGHGADRIRAPHPLLADLEDLGGGWSLEPCEALVEVSPWSHVRPS